MRFGVVVFPGTWSDTDCHYVVQDILHQDADYLWHMNKPKLLGDYDCIILPGGFSYGDYLRAGSIARFSPIMSSIAEFSSSGGLVLGICNGFQILCEAGLLPGALVRNHHLKYKCQWTSLRVENGSSPFTSMCQVGTVLQIPISHGEGNFYADKQTLQTLEDNKQVLFRYCTPAGNPTSEANPNGSSNNIAGIINEAGNVLGMMPHPERCCEEITGGSDGLLMFQSILRNKVGN